MERVLRKSLKDGKFENVSARRSQLMGRIRSKGNLSTELSFRLALVRAGIRGWTLHPKYIFGTPDFYFPGKKFAVFVDGCFWHGCKKCGHVPRVRSAFWRLKFERNKARSKAVQTMLKKSGIKVVRIWEHELKFGSNKALRRLQKLLDNQYGINC